jgi:hypothetical protein
MYGTPSISPSGCEEDEDEDEDDGEGGADEGWGVVWGEVGVDRAAVDNKFNAGTPWLCSE